MPKVFIIVLNWNGLKDTQECIESLEKIDYPNYKIVVVDNGSIDESLEKIPYKYPEVAFIETKNNLGFAGGNNVGIRYVLDLPAGESTDYILLLNNDTAVEPDFLTKLVEAAESDEKIGIAGPMIYFYGKRDTIWFAGGELNWVKTKGKHVGYGKTVDVYSSSEDSSGESESRSLRDSSRLAPQDRARSSNKTVDYITGCCLLIKRQAVDEIGLLCEDYFLYYEDADWCLRAKKAGWRSVLVPSASIFHKHSKSAIEGSYPYIYYHTRNGLLFASRFGSKTLAYLISFWIFCKQIVKLIIGWRRAWTKAVLRGVKDFWKGKTGKLEGYY